MHERELTGALLWVLEIDCPTWVVLTDQLVHLHDVRVLHVFEIDLTQPPLDDTSSKVGDVMLLQGNRFDEQIVARTNQIEDQDLVIADDCKHPFVVADGVSWRKIHNDAVKPLRWYDSSGLVECEYIALIIEELVTGRQFRVVMDGEQARGSVANLDLSEVHRLVTEVHLVGLRCPGAIEVEIVATLTGDLVAHHANDVRDLWLVGHLHEEGGLRGDGPPCEIE